MIITTNSNYYNFNKLFFCFITLIYSFYMNRKLIIFILFRAKQNTKSIRKKKVNRFVLINLKRNIFLFDLREESLFSIYLFEYYQTFLFEINA